MAVATELQRDRQRRRTATEKADVLARIAGLDEQAARFGLSGEGKAMRAQLVKDLAAHEFAETRASTEAAKALGEALAEHELAFKNAATALEVYVKAKERLNAARSAAGAAERRANTYDVLTATHGDAEREFFLTSDWRHLHDRVKAAVGQGML